MKIQKTRKIRPRRRKSSSPDPTKLIISFLGAVFAIILITTVVRIQSNQRQESKNRLVAENDKLKKALETEMALIQKAKKQQLQNQKEMELQLAAAKKKMEQVNTVKFDEYRERPALRDFKPREIKVKKKEEPKKEAEEVVPIIDKFILSAQEEKELQTLKSFNSQSLTDQQLERLKELKAKYSWFKANRFKLTNTEMEIAWKKRWTKILASNVEGQKYKDAVYPRPLQILLSKAKTSNERAYFMRIFRRPTTFKEKKMVHEAKGQAHYERYKYKPTKFISDRGLKKGVVHQDEYGYKYTIDGSGRRLYK